MDKCQAQQLEEVLERIYPEHNSLIANGCTLVVDILYIVKVTVSIVVGPQLTLNTNVWIIVLNLEMSQLGISRRGGVMTYIDILDKPEGHCRSSCSAASQDRYIDLQCLGTLRQHSFASTCSREKDAMGLLALSIGVGVQDIMCCGEVQDKIERI